MFLLPSERQYINLLNSHDLFPEPLSLQSLFLDVATHIPGAAKFKNTDEMAAVVLHRRMERTVQGNRHLLGAARQVRQEPCFACLVKLTSRRLLAGFPVVYSRVRDAFLGYQGHIQGAVAASRALRQELCSEGPAHCSAQP